MDYPELQEYWDQMRNDPRPIDELVSAALLESDEDVAWNAICTLHFRGTEDVLTRAEMLCRSDSAKERCVGANILGQLGVPDRTFPRQCLSVLLGMLDHEKDADVLQAILLALGHLKELDAIEPASRHREHPDPDVRHGVVVALTGHVDQRAVDWLIELSCDEVAHVRDWATFALAQMIDLDTPAIREALNARLDDTDCDARCEAIVGLAVRGDDRAVPAIRRELAANCVGYLLLEAAEATGNAQLYGEVAKAAARTMIDVSPPQKCNSISRGLRP